MVQKSGRDVGYMKKKWRNGVIIASIIIVIGVFTYFGLRNYLIDKQSPSEELGNPILQIIDDDVALKEFPVLDEDTVLREYSLRVIELINIEREKAGVGTLIESDLLYDAASLRARELEALFSHNRPDGSLCFTVYAEFGIKCNARAENIAAGYASPEAVVEAWMKSEGHSRNILNTKYGKIGVGVHQDSTGKIYWSQFFAD